MQNSGISIIAFLFWSGAAAVGLFADSGPILVYLEWVCAVYAFVLAKAYYKLESIEKYLRGIP